MYCIMFWEYLGALIPPIVNCIVFEVKLPNTFIVFVAVSVHVAPAIP